VPVGPGFAVSKRCRSDCFSETVGVEILQAAPTWSIGLGNCVCVSRLQIVGRPTAAGQVRRHFLAELVPNCPSIRTTLFVAAESALSRIGYPRGRSTQLAMPPLRLPFHFVFLMFAGWVNRHQLDVIDYLQEASRVPKERLGGRRIRFTDAERRRLARKAQAPRSACLRDVMREGETECNGGRMSDGAIPRPEVKL
jgi:hypothetical protein